MPAGPPVALPVHLDMEDLHYWIRSSLEEIAMLNDGCFVGLANASFSPAFTPYLALFGLVMSFGAEICGEKIKGCKDVG